ncbi:MAG: HPF/RaiA family ribosome-associated protein [Pseudomonadota bacterium]
MNISIFTKNVPLKRELKEFVHRLIYEDFYTFKDRISNVKVIIEDVNGPNRGGVDKECRIKLKLIPRGLLIVHQQARTIAEALDLASARLWFRLSKKIELKKIKKTLGVDYDLVETD